MFVRVDWGRNCLFFTHCRKEMIDIHTESCLTGGHAGTVMFHVVTLEDGHSEDQLCLTCGLAGAWSC